MRLLGFSEDLLRIRKLSPPVLLDKPNLSGRVDDERGATVRVELWPVDAVLLGRLSMNIGEQRIRDSAKGLGPGVVAKHAVRANPHDLGIGGLEVLELGFEGRHLFGSPWSPVQHVKEQHRIFLPPEFAQGVLLAADSLEREIWGRIANFDFRHDASSFHLGRGPGWPPSEPPP